VGSDLIERRLKTAPFFCPTKSSEHRPAQFFAINAFAANVAFQAFITQMPNTHFIDTGNALLSGGEPNPENYIFCYLQLSAEGYEI
jgi:hypothetical protein